jgi:hypothetical protein
MHINANLHVVYHECETYFILKEEQRLRLFENQVPIKRFAIKRRKITFLTIWRELYLVANCLWLNPSSIHCSLKLKEVKENLVFP